MPGLGEAGAEGLLGRLGRRGQVGRRGRVGLGGLGRVVVGGRMHTEAWQQGGQAPLESPRLGGGTAKRCKKRSVLLKKR